MTSHSQSKSPEEITNSILDWSQENHGMSPYLRTSLFLGIMEAIKRERASKPTLVLPPKARIDSSVMDEESIVFARHQNYWIDHIARLNAPTVCEGKFPDLEKVKGYLWDYGSRNYSTNQIEEIYNAVKSINEGSK